MDDETIRRLTADANLDRLLASLPGVATAVARYFFALTDRGLTRDEALVVVVSWQETVLTMAREEYGR